MDRLDLTAIEASWLDGTFKGVPPAEPPFQLKQLGAKGWNVLAGDLPLPAAVLRDAVLTANADWMRRFLQLSGAKLCPHGKTTMSPQLFDRQLADGAWGLTLATMQQVCVARRYGARRILLANQLASRPAIEYLASELARDPQFDFYCLVDSPAAVELLDRTLAACGATRAVGVLVEIGVAGKRTGCRDVDAAMETARAAARTDRLALRGVEGFEGVIAAPDPAVAAAQVGEFLARMVETARRCLAERLFAPGRIVLTAGGSVYFDLVAAGLSLPGAEDLVDVLVRSGCYLSHDSAILDRLYKELLDRAPEARAIAGSLRPALEVWAHVQSRPEPTRVVLTLGKRDASHDADLPITQTWHRPGRDEPPRPLVDHRVVALHDQHAMLDVPADSELQVGDLVGCGISHPCTTFDRWPLLFLVDETYRVIGGVRTFF